MGQRGRGCRWCRCSPRQPNEPPRRDPPATDQKPDESEPQPILPSLDGGSIEARWTTTLRTVHLVEGFLVVPAEARKAYPPRAAKAGAWEVLRGKWFDTGDDPWVWLDRERNLLCGPDLADRLAWCEAGEKLCIVWATEAIVFRSAGIDEQAQSEEARLVDREALAELRGEPGESYRQSLAAILRDAPEGLTFRELATALCERQRHSVHRGTIRAVLYAGGFVCRGRRWFVLAEGATAQRRGRRTLALTLIENPSSAPEGSSECIGELAKAITRRLEELMGELNARH
jgi:hypothetical protein